MKSLDQTLSNMFLKKALNGSVYQCKTGFIQIDKTSSNDQ